MKKLMPFLSRAVMPLAVGGLFCGIAARVCAQTLTNPPTAPQVPSQTKGDQILTKKTQVSPPAFVALRGTLKADKKTLQNGEPVTFTYSVTNTSKTAPQAEQFSSGQRFDLVVSAAKGGTAPLWKYSMDRMFPMMVGNVTFAPGETKTFSAVWTPAPGTIKPGASFTVSAYLTPIKSDNQTARATLTLKAATNQ